MFSIVLFTKLLNKFCIIFSIFCLATVSRCRIFCEITQRLVIEATFSSLNLFTPIKVKTVKFILSQKLDWIFNELRASIGTRDECRKSSRTLIPAWEMRIFKIFSCDIWHSIIFTSDSEHRLEIFVVCLETCKLSITACSNRELVCVNL